MTRVIQWATGAIGKTTLRAVLADPSLELVGLFVYGDRKAGKDVGEIARRRDVAWRPTGVLGTRDRDQILALDADVVLHTPRLQVPYSTHDADLCALLRSGKNVITTAGNHYPRAHGGARQQMFAEACEAGRSTLYGVGISPGVVGERLALALTGVSMELTGIVMDEVLDASRVPDPDFVFQVMGMGGDPASSDFADGELAELYGHLYAETIVFVLDRLGLRADRIEPDHKVVAATRELKVPAGRIAAGRVAATEWRWHAIVDGKRFFTLAIIWTMDPELADYAGRDHWTITLSGRPEMTLTLNLTEPDEPALRTRAGQYVTAAPVIHAIPHVLAAPPGVFEPAVFAPYAVPASEVGCPRP